MLKEKRMRKCTRTEMSDLVDIYAWRANDIHEDRS